MAGRRKGGKGSKRSLSIGRRGEGNGLQGRYCFLGFLPPPGERKNPDWSDFMNYPIRRSDWSATCHSCWSSQIYSFNMLTHIVNNQFELSVEKTLRSLDEI